MTEETIRQQQAFALLAHTESKVAAEHARTRVRNLAAAIKAIGAQLESNPRQFAPDDEPLPTQMVVRRAAGRVAPTVPDTGGIVDLDAIALMVREMLKAEAAMAVAAKNAADLGMPV